MSENHQKIRVGIIKKINDSSFNQNSSLFNLINEELIDTHKPYEIFIDQNGIWHYLGLPILPMDLHNKVDVVWNQIDPFVSQILSNIKIPQIGYNSFNFILEKNKDFLKKYLANHSIKMAGNLLIPPYFKDIDGDIEKYSILKAKDVWNKFSPPFILHTKNEDKNTGIFVVKTFPELVERIFEFANKKENILVEEMILGEKKVFHFLPKFRNQDFYPLYTKNSSQNTKEEMQKIGEYLIKDLNIKNYVKFIFLVKKDKIYLDNMSFDLNLNDPLFSELLEGLGLKKANVVEHILKNATI